MSQSCPPLKTLLFILLVMGFVLFVTQYYALVTRVDVAAEKETVSSRSTEGLIGGSGRESANSDDEEKIDIYSHFDYIKHNKRVCSKLSFREYYMQNNMQSDKYLVYQCKERCMGFSDRIRGIFTSFMISLLTGRRFFIDYTHPSNVSDIFVENEVEWMWKEEYARDKTVIWRPMELMAFKAERKVNFWSEDIESWLVNHYVTISRNGQILADSAIEKNSSVAKQLARNNYANTVIVTKFNEYTAILKSKVYEDKLREMNLFGSFFRHRVGCVFEFLFRPSTKVMQKYDEFLAKNSGYYLIGMNVRLGGIGKDPLLVGSSNVNWFEECAKNVTKNVEMRADKQVKWFIASDNEDYKKDMMRKYGDRIVVSDLTVQHIDYDANTEGHVDAIVEHFLLQSCDELIISRSGYGELAVDLSGKKHNHFLQSKICV